MRGSASKTRWIAAAKVEITSQAIGSAVTHR